MNLVHPVEIIPPPRQRGMSLEQVRFIFMQGCETGTIRERNAYMDGMRRYIIENFKQKKCSRFVPRPDQNVERTRDLKCKCGEIFTGHFFHSIPDTWQNHMSDGIRQIMARDNWENPPPENIPCYEWKSEDIIREPSNSFGKINFANVEDIGRTKSAKYIRLSNEDSVDKTLELMEKHWRMMDPRPPHLVISVVGGSENFDLNGKMSATFNKGLIMAAKTTYAWLITSGFNVGVMKYVGQAVKKGQSYFWDDGVAHSLQCIGIVPWGYVKDRHPLEGSRRTVNIESSNVIEPGKPLPINPDHTHFIFVDDGYRNRNDGVAEFRANLENKLAAPKTAANGLAIPLVKVVINGGPDAINDVLQSIEHGIPVVTCAGTGQAADIMAYACSGTTNIDQEEREIEKKILDAYRMSFNANEVSDKCKEVLEKVKKCREKAELITIFDMTEQGDLHESILSALLNAHSSSSLTDSTEMESQRLKQLGLALSWNRVDIAREKIFREDVQWSNGSLDGIMTEAICNDNVEFVRLFLHQGINMKKYLTRERLKELYEMRPNEKLMERIFSKLISTDLPSIDDLPNLLNGLLDKYKCGYSDGRFIRPYKELFIWALLYGRRALAKLFWEMGEEPVTSAIAATRIYESLSDTCTRQELHLKEKFDCYKSEFENLAIRVLNACHSVDPDMAMILVERPSPSWDSVTCMEMAASANDQKFMSTAACQNSIGTQWRSGIQSHWIRVVIAAFMPLPLLGALFLKVRGIHDNGYTPFCQSCRDDNYCQKTLEKFLLFRRSPIYKFCNSMVWYLAFTVLFTYFILVDFKAYEVTTIEYLCMGTICTYIWDEVVCMVLLSKAKKWCDIRKWYGVLKILELLNFILALVGLITHKTFTKDNDFMVVKAIYSVNCVIFYIRFTKLFTTNATLGPKLFMIKRMAEELLMFLLVLAIFLMAFGVAIQSMLYTQRKSDWAILKDILYYPYWQLFGDLYVEESTQTDFACISSYFKATNTTGGITPCQTSHWLVPVLLACYLMVGNLLLMNLLIAIFSHVVKNVEENSQVIWKFQLYVLCMEYRRKTSCSPPINILTHIFLLFRWSYQMIRRKCTQRGRIIDELYDTMSYSNLVPNKYVIAYEDIEQYVQLYEKEMMISTLNQSM